MFTNLFDHQNNQDIISICFAAGHLKSHSTYGNEGPPLLSGFVHVRTPYRSHVRIIPDGRSLGLWATQSFHTQAGLISGHDIRERCILTTATDLGRWACMCSCNDAMPGNKIPWLATLSGFADTRVPECQPLVNVHPQIRNFASASAF